ncbi:OmpP1/FadL family transporter [Pedobacter sp. NJ-S-72]
MAFDNFLIDQKSGDNLSYVPATSQTNTQSKTESRVGSTSELNFSGAINISNQLYLGASIGFVNMRYINNSVYTEQGTIINTLPVGAPVPARPNTEVGKNYDLAYSTGQHTTGSGINGRLGLIYKPINEVRIGATFQAPTWMHVEEDYAEVLDTRFSLGGVPSGSVYSNIYNSNFNYNLRTPYKASLGGSVIIGQNGLLSADIDYVDYASTKLSVSDGYSDLIRENNQYIKQNYKSAVNYRIGGEYRIDDFTLRAGYGLNGTPYKSDDKNVFDVKYYSGGLGYRFNQYYVDLAYQRTETTNTFAPYELNNFSEPVATAKVARNNVFLTVGVKF